MARTLSVAKPPPPIFLAPLLAHQTPKCIRSIAPFSTSTPFLQRRRRKRDNNMDRGVSALRRTGLRYPVEMSKVPLPQPVLDPKKRSEISVDENHGLWGFFRADKKLLSTPEELTEFGRPWTVEELRHKSWEDLHSLWYTCCKERNILHTQERERSRLNAGYGEAEFKERDKAVKRTQRAIKHALTERWYAWEDARRIAADDEEVNLNAQPGERAYLPIYDNDPVFESDGPKDKQAAKKA
ncbi:MAG: hypothetical protein Q9190_005539 [Brigantiaea leucoxantha]